MLLAWLKYSFSNKAYYGIIVNNFSKNYKIEVPNIINWSTKLPAFLLVLASYPQSKLSLLESKESSPSKVSDEDDSLDENCPFCQYFLNSPCENSFRVWRACIKERGEGKKCMEPFEPLHKCMKENGLMEEEKDEASKQK